MRAAAARHLRAGLSIFRIQLAQGLSYRLAALAGAFNGTFWGLIEITVYRVFFAYAQGAWGFTGMTLEQVISYTWLAQCLFFMLPSSVDGEFLELIDNGGIGIELCRPLGLYVHWFAKNAGIRITGAAMRGVVTLFFALVMPSGWRLSPPASAAGLLLFIVSVFAALLLCTAYANFLCAVRLDVRWGNGPMYMLSLIPMVVSGGYLPLQLWPDFMQGFLAIQPFSGYMDTPLRFYLGSYAPARAPVFLGLQLGWSAFFILLGWLLMRLRLRRIVVQGG